MSQIKRPTNQYKQKNNSFPPCPGKLNLKLNHLCNSHLQHKTYRYCQNSHVFACFFHTLKRNFVMKLLLIICYNTQCRCVYKMGTVAFFVDRYLILFIVVKENFVCKPLTRIGILCSMFDPSWFTSYTVFSSSFPSFSQYCFIVKLLGFGCWLFIYFYVAVVVVDGFNPITSVHSHS